MTFSRTCFALAKNIESWKIVLFIYIKVLPVAKQKIRRV